MDKIVVGYSLYLNGKHYSVYESLQQAIQYANRYGRWNKVDIQPMIRFI